jgi:Reverse transcriptase (RNA-dependent DNA polymerase)
VARRALEYICIHNYATFNLKTYPQEWKIYDTVVLRKPGRTDYTLTKSYRPVVLLKTIAKPLSIAVAEDLSYILETHQILPKFHFGARPGRTTTDAIHLLVKYVQDAWRVGKVVSALFLDVKGAFPSVDIGRLRHEMTRRGLPEEYTEWIGEKLSGRATTICFDDFCSQTLSILAGLDQGCPLSPTLYNIYNATLLEVAKPGWAKDEMASGFLDDVVTAARGATFEEANERLERMMEREGGALDWAQEANCEFEISKFALVGFSRKMTPKPFEIRRKQPAPRYSITIRGKTIKPSRSTKFLGIIIEQSLSWMEQTAAALAKGTDWAIQCRRIAKPTQGVPLRYALRLYLTVGIRKMLYGVDIWGAPRPRRANAEDKRKCGGQMGRLAGVQRQALLMLGPMRTTATDVLEAHANALPFHLLLDKERH